MRERVENTKPNSHVRGARVSFDVIQSLAGRRWNRNMTTRVGGGTIHGDDPNAGHSQHLQSALAAVVICIEETS